MKLYASLNFLFLSFSIFAGDLPTISLKSTHEEFLHALRVGGCYVAIPKVLQNLAQATFAYAQNIDFNDLPEELKPYYGNEPTQQHEMLFFNKENWENSLPGPTFILAKEMETTGVKIIHKCFDALAISKEQRGLITGGLTQGNGDINCKINHYAAEANKPGLKRHKDIRWVTFLIAPTEGLSGEIDTEHVPLRHGLDYFIVNFGVFFEAFDPTRVAALIHQVEECRTERSSFVVTLSGRYPCETRYQFDAVTNNVKEISREDVMKFLVKDPENDFKDARHKID